MGSTLCPDGGMVYTEDLKSSAARLVGSSPTPGTKRKVIKKQTTHCVVCFFMCPGEDLNLHESLRLLLRQVRLPISPPGHDFSILAQENRLHNSLLRRGRELNPRMAVLQTAALPLRHHANGV